MLRGLIKTILLIILIVTTIGCKEIPLPPEADKVSVQEHSLWRTGAETYAPGDFIQYKAALETAKKHLQEESQRFRWFRNYEKVQSEFRVVLAQGDIILNKVQEQKRNIAVEISEKTRQYQERVDTLRKLSSLINEGRVASRSLAKAEILLKEIDIFLAGEKYRDASDRLYKISVYISDSTRALNPILTRYTDRSQITKWKKLVQETIEESRRKGIHSIVVSKLDRELILYRAGRPYKTYEINVGSNGSKDKMYSGDKATPEGRYEIIKKIHNSKYHKALLINYPNNDDRRQFAIARKNGLIPRNAGIGGLIEVHGGGKNGMTYGCIALDNRHMDELFHIVEAGTPITIVGAIDYENSISSAVSEL